MRSLHSAMPLEQVQQLPGALANAELQRRGLWPLTPRELCIRIGLPEDELGASADHRHLKGFDRLGNKSSTRTMLPALTTKLCVGVAGLLNCDADALWEGMVARFKPATPAVLPTSLKLGVISESKVVTSLVSSLSNARARGAPVPELAQILSPLAAQYSLRIFNTTFEVQLDSKPVQRHLWSQARMHLDLWQAAQSAEPGGGHQRIRLSMAALNVSASLLVSPLPSPPVRLR